MASTVASSSTRAATVHARTPQRTSHSRAVRIAFSTPIRRLFHGSSVGRATDADFYKTLEVSRNASQKDIKSQFYKLSKKWHPDVNQGSDESKTKFQEVSEAYATLGQESSRKQYDRQRPTSAFGTPRASRGGMRYDSDNLQRRATASYAWEYQRRNTARAHQKANAKGNTAHGASSSSDGTGRAHYQHEGTRFGTGGASPSGTAGNGSMFERLAKQQQKREAAAAARQQSSDRRGDFVSPDYGAGTSSHLVRFMQVTAVLGLIGYLTSYASTGDNVSTSTSRRRIA